MIDVVVNVQKCCFFLSGYGEFLSDNYKYERAFILLVTCSMLEIKWDKCNENRFVSSKIQK